MRYIVVDLEMNRMDKKYKEERQICNMEIIEIGAVMLDDSFREIAHYKTYVKPQFSESIGAFYEKLTGITTAMVEDAPVFEDAIRDFLESVPELLPIQREFYLTMLTERKEKILDYSLDLLLEQEQRSSPLLGM